MPFQGEHALKASSFSTPDVTGKYLVLGRNWEEDDK